MFQLLVTLGLCGIASCYTCTYSFGGDNYDATPLENSTVDYHFNVNDVDFLMNICQPTVATICGTDCAACQQWTNGQACLGAASTAQFNPPNFPGVNGKGFTIQFTGGTMPPGINIYRSMEIDMICDPDAGFGSPIFAGEDPELHYNFQWRSSYACPASDPCNTATNCNLCKMAGSTCGWCAATQMCKNGTKEGPTDGSYCYGAWQFQDCYRCNELTSCEQCTYHNADCAWCVDNDNQTSCQPWGTGCQMALFECQCDQYGTCSDCVNQDHCQWCGSAGQCQDFQATCPGGASTTSCPCGSYSTCSSCRSDSTCAWCSESSTCINRKNVSATCLFAHNCNSYCAQGSGSCFQCAALDGCSWCSDSQQCVDSSFTGGCMVEHSCEVCSHVSDCDVCNGVPGCGWCESNSRCMDTLTDSCGGMWQHSCPSHSPSPAPSDQKSTFDPSSFVGGMFLIIGIVVLGVAGYVVYRWKCAKPNYSELK